MSEINPFKNEQTAHNEQWIAYYTQQIANLEEHIQFFREEIARLSVHGNEEISDFPTNLQETP